MKIVGTTIEKGELVNVYECEWCGNTRSIHPEIVHVCEVKDFHEEEASVGNI